MTQPGIEPGSPGPLGGHTTHEANEPVIEREKEDEMINKYLDLAREQKNEEHDSDSNCSWWIWIRPERLGQKIGGIGNQRMNEDHLDHSIVKTIKKIWLWAQVKNHT